MMKVTYDREEDVLSIEMMSQGIIDHAEQTDSLIAHFTADGHLVLLEILDASQFLASVLQLALRGEQVPAWQKGVGGRPPALVLRRAGGVRRVLLP